MSISTKERYALRLMLDIASREESRPVPLRAVSESQGISYKYLEQIVMPLAHSGLLQGARGAQGGYKLGKPAAEITCGEILRACESDFVPIACISDPNECEHSEGCLSMPFWRGLNAAVNDYADSVSLADLLDGKAGE